MIPLKKQPTTVGGTFARRVREVRRRRGWSQRGLADRLSKAGRPLNGAMIAKIEAGSTRAENVTVRDLLTFAAVLGVNPLHLIIPLDGGPTDLGTPTVLTDELGSLWPEQLRGWIAGHGPLVPKLGPWNEDIPQDDWWRVYFTEAPLHEVEDRQERLARWERNAAGIAALERQEGRPLTNEEIAERVGASAAQVTRARDLPAATHYSRTEDR